MMSPVLSVRPPPIQIPTQRTAAELEVVASLTQVQTRGRVPTSRFIHAACQVYGKLYIFGGRDKGGESLNDSHIFDPITSGTAELEPMPKKLAGHTACVYENRVYIWGGYDGLAFNDQLFCYTPKTNSWEKVSPIGSLRPPARYCHAAVIYNDNLIIVGGDHSNSDKKLKDLWSFNITNTQWTELLQPDIIPEPRQGLTAAVYDECLYTYGGFEKAKHAATDALWKYNFISHEWQLVQCKGTIPNARHGHAGVVFGDSWIIHGGRKDHGEKYNIDVYEYQFDTSEWRRLGVVQHAASPWGCPAVRFGHQACLDPYSNAVFISGGYTHTDGVTFCPTSTILRLDLLPTLQTLTSLHTKLAPLEDKVSTAMSETRTLKDVVNSIKSEFLTMNDELKSIAGTTESFKMSINELQNNISNLQNDVKSMCTCVPHIKQQISHLTSKVDKLPLNELDTDLTKVSQGLEALQEAAKQGGGLSTFSDTVSSLKEDIHTLKDSEVSSSDITKLKNKFDTLDKVMDKIDDIEKLNTLIKSTNIDDIPNLYKQISSLEECIRHQKQDIKDFKDDMTNTKIEISNLKSHTHKPYLDDNMTYDLDTKDPIITQIFDTSTSSDIQLNDKNIYQKEFEDIKIQIQVLKKLLSQFDMEKVKDCVQTVESVKNELKCLHDIKAQSDSENLKPDSTNNIILCLSCLKSDFEVLRQDQTLNLESINEVDNCIEKVKEDIENIKIDQKQDSDLVLNLKDTVFKLERICEGISIHIQDIPTHDIQTRDIDTQDIQTQHVHTQDIQELKDKVNELKQTLDGVCKFKDNINDLQSGLTGVKELTYGLQSKFDDLETLKKSIKNLQQQMDKFSIIPELQSKISSLNYVKTSLEELRKAIIDIKNSHQDIKNDSQKTENNQKEIFEKLERLMNQTVPKVEAIEVVTRNLEKRTCKLEDNEVEYVRKREAMEEKYKVIDNKVTQLQDDINKLQELESIFSIQNEIKNDINNVVLKHKGLEETVMDLADENKKIAEESRSHLNNLESKIKELELKKQELEGKSVFLHEKGETMEVRIDKTEDIIKQLLNDINNTEQAIDMLLPMKDVLTQLEKDTSDIRHKVNQVGDIQLINDRINMLKTSIEQNINETKKMRDIGNCLASYGSDIQLPDF